MKKFFVGIIVVASLLLASFAAIFPGTPAEGFWCHTGPSDSNHWSEFDGLVPGLQGPAAMARILEAFVNGETTLVQVVKIFAVQGKIETFLVHLLVGGKNVLWVVEPGRQGTMFVPRDGETYISAKMNRPGTDLTTDPATRGLLNGEASCRVQTAPAPISIPVTIPVGVAAAALLGFLALGARRPPYLTPA